MNKTAIKNFSVRARRKLIEEITQKAYKLGIKENRKHEEIEVFEGGFSVKNVLYKTVYPISKRRDRQRLIDEISQKGFEQVMEEVAYTWFNRIIAIRFMEVNEYLPVKVRVLSSGVEGDAIPEIITHVYDYVEAFSLDPQRVYDLKESHKDEELFREVFFKVCNQLGALMPQVFEEIADYTELLLPDSLLTSKSVIRDLVESIDEEDFKEEVEIIGWMYQYYISEKKDEVFAGLKKNKKITKENIPAATQLFTPKWIVQYMTENSLGRLWQESHPNEELKRKWEYYIEPAEQEPEVQQKLDALRNPSLNPEEITILDPAMGSGHILVYAFDVLYDIYLSRGYMEREIPYLILEKNLFGIDIDDRAAQLASFALLMKARSKNRRFFSNLVELNLCSIQESNGISENALETLLKTSENPDEHKDLTETLQYLLEVYNDAKEYGSILQIEYKIFDSLKEKLQSWIELKSQQVAELSNQDEMLYRIIVLIKQAEIMSQKYDVVITNPPYMGSKGMNTRLKSYLSKNYSESKSDLFAVFMQTVRFLTKQSSYWAMINQHSWMFLKSFEKLRKGLLNENTIMSMIHLGPRAFEEIAGEVVQSTVFVVKNNVNKGFKGDYIRVIDEENAESKRVRAKESIQSLDDQEHYLIDQAGFEKIPGKPIAYWVNQELLRIFDLPNLMEKVTFKEGITTANNNRFLRFWHEVSIERITENYSQRRRKWVPYNKGGSYRKWYGNNDYVVDWSNDGASIKTYPGSSFRNSQFQLSEGGTFSALSSGAFSARYSPKGSAFDSKGTMFFSESHLMEALGWLNSKVFNELLKFVAPTLDYRFGTIEKLPFLRVDNNDCVEKCISLAKNDWDSFEISRDFRKLPIVENHNECKRIKSIIESALMISTIKRNELKDIEESMNEKYIQKYSLSFFVDPHVSMMDISLSELTENKLITDYVSYFVGCSFGRYSLDEEGLIFAGGHFNFSRYSKYIPTADNLLIITEEDYFENDVLHLFVEFLKVTYGEETLEENLRYIADVLYPKSRDTARDRIRRYFVKDFYKDHCKMYKKRPIYWMIDSGKKNGVKALFYMHRYDKNTIGRFRTDYLHEIQRYYENDIALSENTGDKKRADVLKKKLHEVTEFDKVIAHLAYQQIEFDLDDGVEHNYELFQNVEIPQADGQKPNKANLLEKRK